MEPEELPPDDQIHANAVMFLLDGHEEDAASILLACTMRIPAMVQNSWGDYELTVQMAGPREAYEILSDLRRPINGQIRAALDAVLPWGHSVQGIAVRVAPQPVPPEWRKELLETARGQGVHNQGPADAPVRGITWNNLRFRSESERRIAAALDQSGVLYLPNCKARLGLTDARRNREPDFLVCQDGKWGILEVDGEPFHPASRTVEDHERDRLFKAHGIRVVEHFDATKCYEAPQAVVKKFLDILKQS